MPKSTVLDVEKLLICVMFRVHRVTTPFRVFENNVRTCFQLGDQCWCMEL